MTGTPTPSAAHWVAKKNGEVVAEAETAKKLLVILNEKQITGPVVQKVRDYCRACGLNAHPHGAQCSPDCPICFWPRSVPDYDEDGSWLPL